MVRQKKADRRKVRKRSPASQPTPWAPTRQVPAQTRSPTGTFRFSDRFINTTSTILIIFMFVSIGAGFIIGPLSANVDGDAGEALGVVAMWLIGAGIVLPLLLSGVLGGEAIRAGGGFIGFFLIAGLFATVAGSTELGQDMLGPVWSPRAFWGGIALMVVAGAGFWIIGWIARVPMWLQAPVLGSPRVYVRGSSDNPRHRVFPNDLDERDR